MSGNPLIGRVEVFGETPTSVVYCLPGETTVLKAPELWLDGKRYDRRPLEGSLAKEDTIYTILGEHPRIVKSLGLEDIAPGVTALRLERATIGCVRKYILEHRDNPPPMNKRLRMALEFTEAVAYLHRKGVTWHDISTRNALFFDDLHIKICDFGASFVDGYDFEPEQGYESRYEVPSRGRKLSEIPFRVQELFALGSAIFEITEWKVPYDGIPEPQIVQLVYSDKLSFISEDNPARDIIDRCWHEKYDTAETILKELGEMQPRQLL
ncbi:hypothetical protein ACRALDRAFT_1083579 [Sodiomyces alcalophilus JCM 7366]|uniref:uncharacterized protein n=1 Tax=Sodiomyces alcalophilus JCM 7366 TaxID=591952 RepID=UPI0039B690C8